jgi:hypothetical protein
VERVLSSWPLVGTRALAVALAITGCEDRSVHLFGAERYDPEGHCLEAPATVDVLSGPDPGPCNDLRCWQSPSGEVYVTSAACDAPPDFADRTSDPAGSLCAEALDAFAQKARCDS